MTDKTVAELREQLRDAEERESAERKAKMEATPIVWRYTILPANDPWQEVYDDSCLLYELKGEITNADEAKAAGRPDHSIRPGGMTYVFNKLSGRIVTSTGGGTIFVSGRYGGESKKAAAQEAMRQISRFLRDNPNGGDITEIIKNYKGE